MKKITALIYLLSILLSILAKAQIQNSDFEEEEVSWFVSDTIRTQIIDTLGNKYIQIKNDKPQEFSYFAQSFVVDSLRQKEIKLAFSAKFSSMGGEAGIWVKPLDSLHQNIYFYDKVITSPHWKKDWVVFTVPDDAKRVQIGFKLYGKGQLKIDSVSFLKKDKQKTRINKRIRYLNKLKKAIKRYALNADSIDWQEDFSRALSFSTYTPDQYYLGAKQLLTKLKDGHSFLSVQKGQRKKDLGSIEIKAKKINNEIAYIEIPSFRYMTRKKEYLRKIKEAIVSLDSEALKVWIVDLRGNSGGNVYPMIQALLPFIRKGTLGYFEYKTGDRKAWKYNKSGLFVGSKKILKSNKKEYQLKNKSSNTAILINNQTASSAEMLSIIFKEMPNCKLIGDKTKGLTTGNKSIKMDKHSTLNLTTSRMLDKWGVYNHRIAPDIFLENIDLTNTSAILEWF